MFGKFLIVSVGMACFFLGTSSVQASLVSTSIPLTIPSVDWMSIPSALIGLLTIPVVVGIGIFLSIWVILKAMALAAGTSSSGTSSYREFLSARGIPVDDYEDYKDEYEEEYGFYPRESYANRF